MVAIARAVVMKSASRSESSSSLLKRRASRDLVIALMGPVGSGLPAVGTELKMQLERLGYGVHIVKVSDFIRDSLTKGVVQADPHDEDVRYLKYQTGGTKLRHSFKTEILAEYVINRIGRIRLAELGGQEDGEQRKAFLIDQIKHQDEIRLLRLVYRRNLYVIGVMSLQEQREARLREEGLEHQVVRRIIDRDRKEPEGWGQQLEKAFKLADFFLQNPFGKPGVVEKQAKRFIDLIHGSNGVTPTMHEHAMYVAFATGAKSACLSRQVGAAICDTHGRVIAVGANDVPRPGGGLYTSDNEAEDNRCYKSKVCENLKEKQARLDKITLAIREELMNQVSRLEEDKKPDSETLHNWVVALSERAKSSSGILDLIEFSRAVHAEMDALISLSRSGGGTAQDSILYTTTFPCHNCARHIIAAGVSKVYYIEPYEKSLAAAAHDDAIDVIDFESLDESEDQSRGRKVQFIHFSGVSPRAFTELFSREGGRKSDDGSYTDYVDMANDLPEKVTKEYRDSYLAFERKIASIFEQDFPHDGTSSP